MTLVTVSTKYQVVIPKAVRDQLGIQPGQQMRAFAVAGRIELVPVRPMPEMRGFLAGVENTFDREPDRL